MTSDMTELRVWVDIFFNDQNAVDIVRELDDAEIVYKATPNHIVLASEGVLKRAWCLLEVLIRMMAGKQSAVMGIAEDVGGTIRMVDYDGTNWDNLFEEMEAFNQDDKKEIKRRILLACTASEFNERVHACAVSFCTSVSSREISPKLLFVIASPFFLIVAVVALIILIILPIVFIVILIVKAIFIFKAACWNEKAASSYKQLE
jgi:hypothetical protein